MTRLVLVLVLVLVLDPAVRADPTPAWELVAPEKLELTAGAATTFDLDIVPAEDRTISRDGPVRIDVKVPAGVTTSRRRLALSDAGDPAARAPRFSIKLTAAKAGSYDVELRVRFWLCSRQSCKPVRTSKKLSIVVKA